MQNMNICHEFRYGKILYNTLDTYVGKSLKMYGEYSQGEAELFEAIVKPGDIVVEAGANIGAHTVHLAQLAGEEGQVWAFEPQRLVFQQLCANMALNGLCNVHCLQQGLGREAGTARVPVLDTSRMHNWGGVSLREAGAAGEPVAVSRLDDLEIADCNFLKIDVEGMGLQVLQGGERLLAEYRPVIYMEIENNERDQELFRHLSGKGYHIYPHFPPLFNPNNYFHNPENFFYEEVQGKDGEKEIALIVSFNIICLPEGSSFELSGVEEIEPC